jgi:hypothetical protein
MVITFYRSGVRIKLEKGRISAIEPHLAVWSDSTAGFPDLTFLQLLFQQHSLDEMRDHYADVFAAADTHALLNAMFPKSTASIWAFG